MQDSFDNTTMARPESEPGALDNGGNKILHTSYTSDLDKDNGALTEENQLALILAMPTQGAWRKVEKKKGRKS